MATPQSNAYMRLYNHYKNHFLPLDGGILKQPNAFLEAMETIENCVNE